VNVKGSVAIAQRFIGRGKHLDGAVSEEEGHEAAPRRHQDDGGRGLGSTAPPKGFFIDTSMCIGCTACDVACDDWIAIQTTASTCSGRPTTTF
jgi:formate hydrogenlyase subunit 6/NADH:ubiquinone oxidoreductase subunit I